MFCQTYHLIVHLGSFFVSCSFYNNLGIKIKLKNVSFDICYIKTIGLVWKRNAKWTDLHSASLVLTTTQSALQHVPAFTHSYTFIQ